MIRFHACLFICISMAVVSNGCNASQQPDVRQQIRDIADASRKMEEQGNVYCGMLIITENTPGGVLLETEINASRTPLDDKLIKHIRGLPGIIGVDLSRTKITDKGLEVLVSLPDLEYVQLEGTGITDKGIAKLAQAPKLSHIDVRNTKLTKDSITQFSKMKSLRLVYSKGTPIEKINNVKVNNEDDLKTYWGCGFKESVAGLNSNRDEKHEND